MPTVEQIWRHVLPPGTDLVAGEAGIYNVVNWVITLRPSAPGFDNVRGNEFALIDTSIAKSLGVTLPSLVLFLAERAVSGIGLLGEAIPEACEQAQSSRIPILQLPPGSNLAALEASIASLASEERHYLYQREQELSQILME
ncbi:MAG: PucR family transcriptional regulator ligand-binding domain-containing protein, partial [Dehalococcoidales bacterium]|nr:PucR family transcriptional regulator ligand-binding domain-containing protein [Dehalococcoidales bacterium]